MAFKIVDDCTTCDACIPVCANEAISEGPVIYRINPDKCTECVGTDNDPQCVSVCPSDSIVSDPERKESREELQAKYKQIHGAYEIVKSA